MTERSDDAPSSITRKETNANTLRDAVIRRMPWRQIENGRADVREVRNAIYHGIRDGLTELEDGDE